MVQPNVVFVIDDQHRWDFMGYGSNGVTHTPNLDLLAETGTRFSTACCTSPLCCPSRAAIASGRYGVGTGCFTNLHELPPGTPSFVQQFRSAGYRTAAVGKTHMQIHAYDADYTSGAHREYMDSLGWDDICEISGNGMLRQGLSCAYSEFLKASGVFWDVLAFYEKWHYFMDTEREGDPGFVCHEFPLEEAYHETAFVTQQAVDWLGKRERSKPFLLHVGYAAPHSPIEPMPRTMDLYREAPEAEPSDNPEPARWLPNGRRGYRAMITEVDQGVGRIVEHLRAEGELDNTVFVFTADHGELAGDHRGFGKTNFYEPAVRVPLIFQGPGVLQGQASDALAEVIDVGATLCELCGVSPHGLDQGRSLVPVLTGASRTHRDSLYAEMGCDRMLRDARYKLMWGDPRLDRRELGRLHLDKPVDIPPSPCRLFDLAEDPQECHDLSNDPACGELLREMMAKLLARANQNTQAQTNLSRGEYRPLRATPASS